MAINAKLAVELSSFKSGINDAKSQLKTLNAEMKLAESTFKATGNAEQAFATKTTTLTNKLNTQKQMVAQYEKALKSLKDANAENTKEYRNLETEMLNAKAAMMDTEAELNNLDNATQRAAGGANQLVNSVNSIGKKISLDQVINGINGITNGLEKAAKKAVDLGETIWTAIMDSARWSDDTATMATIMDMSVEDYQRYQKVFDTIGDITVSEWHKMKRKVEKAIQDPTEDQNQLFSLLGISTHEMHAGKYGPVAGMAKTYEDLFWEVSRELQRRVESGKMSQASANVYAEALFGKGFDELKPLIALGEEGFKAALKEQEVASEESIQNLAELNDKVIKLRGDFQTLQVEVLGQIAPALSRGAEVLDSLLGKLMDYLESPEGQQALENMGQAVEGLFKNLETIDPEMVVEGFAKVFGDIIGGLKWLSTNSGTVISALEAIVVGWGALKLTGGALELMRLVNGLNSLRNNGMPQLPGTEAGAPAAEAAGGGSVFLTNLMGKLSTVLTGISMADPTGSLALLPQVIMDRTIFGRHLANGENIGEAASASWQAFINSAAAGLGDFWKYVSSDLPNAFWGVMGFKSAEDAAKAVTDFFVNRNDNADAATRLPTGADWRPSYMRGYAPQTAPAENPNFVVEDWEIPVDLEPDEDAKEKLAKEVGTVEVPVQFVFGGGGGGGNQYTYDPLHGFLGMFGASHANGLWSVPYDGYLARLHKNERIVPAREVGSSRNFSSNLYVESMYMNNGTDAAGLASAMAAAQRRTMNGFGS